MTVLEKAARASYESLRAPDAPSWEVLSRDLPALLFNEIKCANIERARAVLMAVREPDLDLIAKGEAACDYLDDPPTFDTCKSVFQAVIDAILCERQP